MDNVISGFLGWHTLVFGLACYVLTQFTRRIVETSWPSLRKLADENASDITYLTEMARWWNQVILYGLPAFWGALASVTATAYPFPEGMQAFSARVFFGIVVGFFCGFMYKVVRRAFAEKIGSNIDSVPPSR